jgi:oxygen-dependent protoporphyrinogen oxidase
MNAKSGDMNTKSATPLLKEESKSTKPKITIVGGGFSGLTMAYELERRGFQVEVFEKKAWGGLIQTGRRPEMQVESAANAFLMSDRLGEMADSIGCELFSTQKIGKRRFIFRGVPRRWPLSLSSTLRILFRVVPLFLWDRSRLAPTPFETVESWTLRVLNREIFDYLISPALQGIYAGDVRELSASLLFGYLFEKKISKITPKMKVAARTLKGSVAPLNGMGEFIEKLRETLTHRGVLLEQREVHDLKGFSGPIVLAVPPPELAPLLAATLGDDFCWGQAPMLYLVRVTVAFRNPQRKVDGFGILFPEKENFRTLGVLSNSQIFENRGEFYNESWILGGARSPQLGALNDAEIIELILADRRRALGVTDEVSQFEVIRWPQGLTHYTVAHERFLKELKPLPNDIFLTGNFLGRLGLSKILEQNAELAQKFEDLYGK